ncbi:SusE domain-containing protein [Sphingobacterium pedocola]|nr:SusE domain-containing protein [Sphingobacterium pedocola]
MKKLVYMLGVLLFFSCKESEPVMPQLEDLIAAYREDDAIRLEVSSTKISLEPIKRREQALLVTWEPLREIESHYPVRYLFKMDVTENNFTTSIPLEEMPEGVFFKSYTHDELNHLIRNFWYKVGGDDVRISVRVIAQVQSDAKFIKPLYSTLDVNLTPFQLDSKPLFLYGSAMGAGNTNMIDMQEAIQGEIYTWRGLLHPGSFKIAKVMDQSFPAFVKDGEDGLKVSESAADDDEGFKITKQGNYAILLDRINLKIYITEIPYLRVYFGGSATPTGWNTPPLMNWDMYKPNVCTLTTSLAAGEVKFSTEPNFSTATLQLRPWRPNASIAQDNDVLASVLQDWKWRVNADEAGMYTIILDVKSMKVQFIKLD